MIHRKVREVKVGKHVHSISIPLDVTIIEEPELYEIVDIILKELANKFNLISKTRRELKLIIYDLVIQKFNKNKYYYKGLNINIIWKQVNLLNKEKYSFKDSPNFINEEEEFDHLCWLKANGKEYSHIRFSELFKRFKEKKA